jgi:hypothetical protein
MWVVHGLHSVAAQERSHGALRLIVVGYKRRRDDARTTPHAARGISMFYPTKDWAKESAGAPDDRLAIQ